MEGLSQAVSCREAECAWHEEGCAFIERLLELIVGPGGDDGEEPGLG